MSNSGNKDGRRALLKEIQEICFAMDELRLFLDTHEDNARALELFGTYMEKRHELITRYTGTYGAIDSYYVNISDGWNWVNKPMPWKREV